MLGNNPGQDFCLQTSSLRGVAKACRDECITQTRSWTHVQLLENFSLNFKCPDTCNTDITALTLRDCDNTDRHHSIYFNANGHSPQGNTEKIIDRAVEWVNNPAHARGATSIRPLSPRIASSGRCDVMRSTINCSAPLSISLTRSEPLDLVSILRLLGRCSCRNCPATCAQSQASWANSCLSSNASRSLLICSACHRQAFARAGIWSTSTFGDHVEVRLPTICRCPKGQWRR